MPEVAIRPVVNGDLPDLMKYDLSYVSSRVWQMDRLSGDGMCGASFREIRLPREMKVEYPRSAAQIFGENQDGQQLILGAFLDGVSVGYVRLSGQVSPRTAWVRDWAVHEKFRLKGIGSALLMAVLEWSMEQKYRRTVVEMQSKNFPAIQLARKLGFEFAGFNDHYYSNQDIALFFARSLK